jgi:hypothetical protein
LISCTPISHALGCLLLATPAALKNALMRYIVRSDGLNQCIN